MKILVAIAQVPDTTAKISFTDNNTKFNATGVQFIVNPYDEWYALVRALEIKEAGLAEKVSVIHVGLSDADATIRKALALGADDSFRIDTEPTDAYFVAQQLAQFVKNNPYDLILLGKETISYNGGITAGILAGLLDYPFISSVNKLEVSGNIITAHQDIEGGYQVVECSLPAVISANKGMAEQRIPNMKGIMAARTKPLNVIPAYPVNTPVQYESFELSQGRVACKFIDPNNVEELVNLLHTEAKVI
ncbi:MAG: electron transfer flavoprotein subunit beta/FixA family protein [Bacteroidia bacterium]|nr:electron transfer flavoprotein subunit beta/FixA family protein [Bacteroidia bacterium]